MAMIKNNWEKANADDEKNNYTSITLSGFIQKQYDKNIVPSKYLYHRCHLIGWNIGGIDVDKRNLMTGTWDFNVEGMKTFEDQVFNYLKENNELANGVNIEAYSIEDNGKFKFNVYIYNVQNGINIDYATGKSESIK